MSNTYHLWQRGQKMSNKYIAIGEGLGQFQDLYQANTYKLKLQEIVEVDDFSYSLWEVIKAQPSTLQELLKINPAIEANALKTTLANLESKGAIVKFPDTYSSEFFDRFSLVPKGQAGKQTGNLYTVMSFPKHDPVEMPVVSYLIWFHAHPIMPCSNVLQAVHDDSGIALGSIVEEFMNWIPLLITCDVLSLRPLG